MPITEFKTRCPAKVNLTFEILGTLADGYHDVCTLLQAVSLEDELTFGFSNDTLERTTSRKEHDEESSASMISYDSYESEFSSEFPMNESNLISKAIRRYQSVVPESRLVNVNVRIKKRIPIESGLAGGSANAAAALVAINYFYEEKLSHTQLLEIGASLGADVPFSLQGGTCIGTHKGDVLRKIDGASKLVLLLVKPRPLSISTPWAFKQFDQIAQEKTIAASTTSCTTLNSATTQTSATHKCADALSNSGEVSLHREHPSSESSVPSTTRAVAQNLKNDLEQVIFAEHSELELLRETMESYGAVAARLTGSGPTLYALLESVEKAELLKDKLITFQSDKNDSKIFPLDFWITESFSRGARVIKE